MKRPLITGLAMVGLWFAFGRVKAPRVVSAPPEVALSVTSEYEAPHQQPIGQPHAFEMNG